MAWMLPRFVALLSVALAIPLAAAAAGERPSAAEVIDRYIASQAVDSEFAYLSLRRFREAELVDDKRLIAMTTLHQGTRSSVLRLQRPKELEGVAALFVDPADEAPSVYQYLPAIGRTQKISGSGARTPFLGSDFTLEDLQREAPVENAYRLLDDTIVSGSECYAVEATPEDPKQSAYRRRVLHIAKDTSRLHQIDFYGEGNEPEKVFSAFGYDSSEVRGRTRRPARGVMIDHAGKTSTILKVIESRIEAQLDAAMFSPKGIGEIDEVDVNGLLLGLDFAVSFDAQ